MTGEVTKGKNTLEILKKRHTRHNIKSKTQ